MLKKITMSTFLSAGLLLTPVSTYAALPPKQPPMFFLNAQNPSSNPDINDLFSRFFRLPETAHFQTDSQPNFLNSLTGNAQRLTQAYRDLVHFPLENLLRRFTREHAINFQTTEDGNYHAMIFNDPTIINIANRIRKIYDMADTIADFILSFQSTGGQNVSSNEFNSKLRFINSLNAEILRINSELDQKPANKPTQADFFSGNCIDSNLF